MDLHQIILAATEAVQNAVEHLPTETLQSADSATHTEESGGVLGTLGINWKLFLAQLVNFSIVLFIFWKWIVKPLGRTLSERQEKIEKGLMNAQAMEEGKKEFDNWRINEMKKARVEADQIIKSATDTATKLKQEIIQEAHTQSGKMMEQTKASMANEKELMMKEVKQEVANLVVMASEKVIKQKLDSKHDNELISEAIKKIK